MSSASCKLIFHAPGDRVAFLMYLYIPFMIARAKYAFGYFSRVSSNVRAARDNAKKPSASRSGTSAAFCQGGRVCTKNFASIVASGMYSTTQRCLFFESFDLACMFIQPVFMFLERLA